MKIITFPYAFGNSNIYYELTENLKNSVEFINTDYPGHGKRFCEDLRFTIHDIVYDMFDKLKNVFVSDEKYCFLGYSMGGIVAYELCQRIAKEGLKLPEHIFILGTSALSHKYRNEGFENYDILKTRGILKKYGNTSDEILENDELIEVLMPIVKADLIALRDYEANPENMICIESDITVIRGSEEDNLTECQGEWKKYIKKEYEYMIYPGNHFFLFEGGKKVIEEITDIILNRI